jgi:hypothetical protein
MRFNYKETVTSQRDQMIITTQKGTKIDTATDLGPEERHILQKLMAWSSLVSSMAQFHDKKKQALKVGWNNSGAVRETRLLALLIQDLEDQIRQRLKEG